MAKVKIAINGFGRIGRLVLKVLAENPNQYPDIEVVAINDISKLEVLAYMLKYDSVYRGFKGTVEVQEDNLIINGKTIKFYANTDPAKMVDPSLTWYIPVTLGGRSGEYSMMGELAYATLWNRAITESEVDFTRRHPVSGTEAGLIGCWSLDGGDAGLLDGVANGAAEHDLTAVAEVGFVADEVKWHVAGLMILVR